LRSWTCFAVSPHAAERDFVLEGSWPMQLARLRWEPQLLSSVHRSIKRKVR
jgi:hypothetical protein